MTQDDYAKRVEKLARGGEDRELAEFRGLMEVPSTFDEGFTWPSFIGAIFVALVMVPGSLYMSLVAGMTIGPAAQWVTVILFIEVARRANKTLKRGEIFILFYLAAAAMTGAMAGGSLLWNQFYAQSVAAQANGIAELLPQWYAPTEGDVLTLRTIFHPAWLPAIGLMIFATIMGRLNNTILGYGLFRLASDVEKLPFPLAPLGAQGILALSEEQEEENPNRDMSQPMDPQKKWRWRVFSIGTVIGICFGAVYIGLPIITGALLQKPIVLLPIPFVDWTPKTGEYLPAVATGISLDLGLVIMGMVLPFYAVLGSVIGAVSMFIANPLLYRADILHTWNTGDEIVTTMFKNYVDFHFSFGVGAALAIALIGIGAMVTMLGRMRRQRTHTAETPREPFALPEGRGDIKFKLIVAVYIVSTLIYILVSGWLIEWHTGVMAMMIFYGFLYTPLISYATARLEGLAGQAVDIPMIREASFILSGYRGVAVWFLPLPLFNYGMQTVVYRQAELTGTKFTSIWKSELVLAPIIVLSSILFANFIWGLAPVPGPQYPFAQRMWEFQAEQQAVINSATLGGYSSFEQALNFKYMGIGLGIGLLLFGVTKGFGLPTFLVYGIFNGFGAQVYSIIPTMIGALLGRYYFQRRLGLLWRQYIPVVAAGYACGVGLIGTFSIGITFLTKSVFQLPF